MATINNYSFSDIIYTIPEGDSPSAQETSAVITITPNSGYAITASNFSIDPSFSDPAVDTVVFTQDGSNVLCTVTFAVGFTMPSNNYDISLCVVGAAEEVSISISGNMRSAQLYNINGNSNENTPYTASGEVGETVTLLTRTYTAVAGYYIKYPGKFTVTVGNNSNYDISVVDTFTESNGVQYLTEQTWTVKYTFTEESVSGDIIYAFYRAAFEIPIISNLNDYWRFYRGDFGSYSYPREIKSTFNSYERYNNSPEDGQRSMWAFQIRMYPNARAIITVTTNYDSSSTVIFDKIGSSDNLNAGGSELVNSETWLSPSPLDITLPPGVVRPVYTFTLSGDIDPSQTNVFTGEEYVDYNGVNLTLTASSSNSITGYTPITQNLKAYQTLNNNYTIPIDWDLTVASGSLLPDTGSLIITNAEELNVLTTSSVTNSSTIQVEQTTSDMLGAKFNLAPSPNDSDGLLNETTINAPFEYEVTAVNSSTELAVSPNVTVVDDFTIQLSKSSGTQIDANSVILTQVDNNTVNLKADIIVNVTGDEDITFTFDLDSILEYIPAIACDVQFNSGGPGITDYTVDLDPAGGEVVFLVNAQGVQDKFEIYHGLPVGVKKSTSSMTASNNYGPFENQFGTPPLNNLPDSEPLENYDQFIGTNSGPSIPTKQTEFNSDTGKTIASMIIGGTTYQQVVWWKYTASDYLIDNIATLRVTGPTGTAWDIARVCP